METAGPPLIEFLVLVPASLIVVGIFGYLQRRANQAMMARYQQSNANANAEEHT